jgi:transposase
MGYDALEKGVWMPSKRRKYTQEFKLEAVKMVTEHGLTAKQASEDLGIDRSLISNWRRTFEAEGTLTALGGGRGSSQDEELRRLRRQLSVARQERDILKKALAYFAKHED